MEIIEGCGVRFGTVLFGFLCHFVVEFEEDIRARIMFRLGVKESRGRWR